MTGPGVGRRVPAGYRFRVDGHLDRSWSAWLGGLTLTHHSDGTSTLSGPVADQAQLHGILAKIRDLGVTLIAVDVVDPPDDDHEGALPSAEPPTVDGLRHRTREAGLEHPEPDPLRVHERTSTPTGRRSP